MCILKNIAMKKLLLFLILASNYVMSAQTSLPKSPNDISPLLIDEKAPNLSLKTAEGETINFAKITKSKKTILVFYRGGWCPYCNAHLSALAEADKELLALGYQIVAISPDAPKSLLETKSKEKVNYTLLSDSDGAFAKAFGIAFQAPKNYDKYLTKGSDGINTELYLPVPSLFILDTEGTIVFEYISLDYKHRITNDLLLSVVKSL